MDKKNKDLEFLRGLEKLKAAPVKAEGYTSPLESDIMRVKGSAPEKELVQKISGMTDKINTKSAMPLTSGDAFKAKIAGLLKGGGKKAIATLPFLGAGYAALQGDSAMAADELAGNIPIAGQVYEAIKPEELGGRADERELLKARQSGEMFRAPAQQQMPGQNLPEAPEQKNIFAGLKKLFGK